MGAAPNQGGVSKDEAVSILKTAQNLIKEAKSVGMDVYDQEQLYKQARPLLKQGDFTGAFQIAEQVIGNIEAMVSDPEPSLREGAPAPEPAGGDMKG